MPTALENSSELIRIIREAMLRLQLQEVSKTTPIMKAHCQTGLPYFESEMDSKSRRLNIDEALELENQSLIGEDLERVALVIRQ